MANDHSTMTVEQRSGDAAAGEIDAFIAADIEDLAIDSELARSPHALACIARIGGNATPPMRLFILRRDHLQRLGIERELADALGRWKDLTHPHVVAPQHIGESARLMWFATPLHPDRSLAERLEQSGRMDAPAALRIAEQLSAALHAAHRRGFAHGEVRPEHVVMTRDGWAQISFFGVEPLLRACGIGLPLPAWKLTPEGAPAESTPVSPGDSAIDQLGLANVFEYCLRGGRHADDSTRWTAAIPQQMRMVIRQATSRRASSRYRTILEFIAALHTAETEPVRESPAERPQELLFVEPRPGQSGRGVRVVGLFIVAAVALAGGLRAFASAFPLGHDDDAIVYVDAPNARPSSDLAIANAAAGPVADPSTTAKEPTRESAPPTGSRSGQRATQPPPRTTPRSSSRPATQQQGSRQGSRAITPPPRATRNTTVALPGVLASPPVQPPRDTVVPVTTPPPPTIPEPPARGTLSVSSRPWGSLFIDGRAVGETPVANIELMPRTYRLRITRDGYMPFERLVEVLPGATVRLVDVVLTPRQGS